MTDQAWQFRPETYGAKGDGKVVSDVVTTATSAVITSATAGFTAADIGKYVMINGAVGTSSGPLVKTIASFQSATQVTLSGTASVSLTGAVMVYGTDDTTAVKAAVSAAGTYATGHGYFAEVLFNPVIYILGTGPTQSGDGATTPTFNSQVPLPYPAANGTSRKMVIALTGAGDAGFVQYWESTTPNLAGSVLVSMTTAPSTPDATFGNQSVVGGPSGAAGFTGGFANVKAVVQGIEIVCGAYTNQFAFDFGFVTAMHADACSAHIFAPSGVNGGNSPLLKDLTAQGTFQATIGSGLRTPINLNNADNTVPSFTVEGYARSFTLAEHLSAGRLFAFYSDVAIKLTGGGNNHLVSIDNLGAEVYNGGILVNGAGGELFVNINMDSEVAAPAYDISDAGNCLRGVVHWADPADRSAPTISGAANLKVVNDMLGPGAWSGQPAVPASTVAQQNTAWRDAAVSVKGGTVTVVAVDGVTVATATGVTVMVPAGKNITLTYSVAPTWAWTLL